MWERWERGGWHRAKASKKRPVRSPEQQTWGMGTINTAPGEGEGMADAMGKAPVWVGETRSDRGAQLRGCVRLPGRQHVSPGEEALRLKPHLA